MKNLVPTTPSAELSEEEVELLAAKFRISPYLKGREPRNSGVSAEEIRELSYFLDFDDRIDMVTFNRKVGES